MLPNYYRLARCMRLTAFHCACSPNDLTPEATCRFTRWFVACFQLFACRPHDISCYAMYSSTDKVSVEAGLFISTY